MPCDRIRTKVSFLHERPTWIERSNHIHVYPRAYRAAHLALPPSACSMEPMNTLSNLHLRSIKLRDARSSAARSDFPFSLPLIQSFEELSFSSPVTFFVGENAAGKSTLLEGIAAAAGSIAVGGADIKRDPGLAPARALAKELRLAWNKRTHKGFFLRAEDFFNYIRRVNESKAEMQGLADEFDQNLSGYGRQLAMGAALGQKAALEKRYQGDLEERSHGEGFLTLFQSRFQPGGLYLLDEPEAALSPTSQLALIAMLKQMESMDSQFIIATHSPILMAYPGAEILSFDEHPIRSVDYDAVDHVRFYRDFLQFPNRFLRQLGIED